MYIKYKRLDNGLTSLRHLDFLHIYAACLLIEPRKAFSIFRIEPSQLQAQPPYHLNPKRMH